MSDPLFAGVETASLAHGWRVARLEAAEGELLVECRGPAGESVTFALPGSSGPSQPGPFDERIPLTYRRTDLPFVRFATVGTSLARVLREALAGADARSAVDAWLSSIGGSLHSKQATGADWRSRARALLVGRPGARVRLSELVGVDEIADLACVLPWVRLELAPGGIVGPCCHDFQVTPARSGAALIDVWRSETLQAFRRGLAGGRPDATCQPSCPRLAGRSDALDTFLLSGGSSAFVENQLCIVDAMQQGMSQVDAWPLELGFSATSFCNYDCLMCPCGEEGTLDDELPASFYQSLTPLLPHLRRIDVLGGEPLASPVFREFLAGDVLFAHESLGVALTTNGSYLSQHLVSRLDRARLEHVTVSLNAATDETYREVNRGVSLARIRENLDALLELRGRAGHPRSIVYSFVVLRRNLAEIRAFADLCRRDDVGMRFMLPMRNRNGQSFLDDESLMRRVEEDLRAVAAEERERDPRAARRAEGEARVLADRLARRVFAPLPDGGLVQLRR